MKVNTIPLSGLEDLLHSREQAFRDETIPASAVRMEPFRGDLVVKGEPRPMQVHVLTLPGPNLGIPAASPA